MGLKEQLLEKLEQADDFLSGEGLAETFGVSRAGIWKAIKALRNEGYDIIAVQKKGYLLKKYGDKLDKSAILEAYYGEIPLKIECHESLASTNDYLKTLAEKGEDEWCVVLSERQTQGKGRLGRAFYSPKGSGIYLSILLRPQISLQEASLLTIFGASIVAQTIEEMLEQRVEIKWVNDIFLHQKKVSGILTEANLSLENNSLDYVILGIGINVTKGKALPEELSHIFGSLFENQVPKAFRNQFVGKLLSRLTLAYKDFSKKTYLEYYKAHSMVIGKEVYLDTPKARECVFVKGIDDDGALLVRDRAGEEKKVTTGEVSLRFKSSQE